jgi:hypothetical protein
MLNRLGFVHSVVQKKMSETAAYLVDNIIPHVKIRQYVLSVPIFLRYWRARGKKLLAKIHKIFALSIEKFYTDQNTNTSRSGSICFVQRFGKVLNLNVHFHFLKIEGVYEPMFWLWLRGCSPRAKGTSLCIYWRL